jgi:acetyl esterase/lipase
MSEIDAIRALLTAKPRPVGWSERRARIDEIGATWPVAGDVKLEEVDLGAVNGEWSIVPGSDAARVLLFFHGGGYCSGSIVSHRRMVTEAGRAAGMRALAIDYRLAPEHPYPAAHEDALKAWRFLRKQGIEARHIAVGGDSAGGNLTITLINRLRAAGEEQPACAWLASPWTDLTMSGASLEAKDHIDPLIHKPYLEELASAYAPPPFHRKDPLIHKAYLEELADAYAPNGSKPFHRKDPLISPLFADLRGFPPTLIQVGSSETLLDDAVRFARAAGLADVNVTLEVWPHMIHAWPMWNAKLAEGREALARAGEFMKRWVRSQPA